MVNDNLIAKLINCSTILCFIKYKTTQSCVIQCRVTNPTGNFTFYQTLGRPLDFSGIKNHVAWILGESDPTQSCFLNNLRQTLEHEHP
jgi:hypothetical protein